MQQEAERLTGQQLVGAELWQYRFDTATMDAAGAKQGKGTWQPAVVVAYQDTTGEHEVGVQETNKAMEGLLRDRSWLQKIPQQRYCTALHTSCVSVLCHVLC
jgi:hypothetical protein